MRCASVFGLMLLVVGSSAGWSQNLVRGTVTDTTGRPLDGVEIVVPTVEGVVRTGPTGAFRITGIPPGHHELLFRHPGWRPRRVEHRFGTADTIPLRVQLTPGEVELPEIAVEARQPTPAVSPKRAAFERRRDAMTGGRFIDDSVLRVREHSALTDVIRSTGGVRIVNIAGGRRAVASAREIGSNTPCFSQVFLDGVRVWSMKDLRTLGPYDLDQHNVVSLQAVEIYRGLAQTPAELSNPGSDCGTIVLWTRDR